MKKTLISLVLAVTLVSPVSVAAKTSLPVQPVIKTAVKAPVVKTPAKVVNKKPAKPVAVKKALEVKTASISDSAVTNPNAACMRAINKANRFCQKIAAGCSSQSTTEKCKSANEKCEVEQQEALALCPTVN